MIVDIVIESKNVMRKIHIHKNNIAIVKMNSNMHIGLFLSLSPQSFEKKYILLSTTLVYNYSA